MSQSVAASELRAVAAGIERQQVMDVVRGATFIGTLLLGWISLHPFVSLGDMQIGWNGAAIMGDRIESIMFYFVNRPADSRVLITDFEIRD